MLTRADIERLAAAANALRPEWSVRSLCTLINTNLSVRAYQDVAVALAWIATDPKTKTPGRILELGPWWRASVDGTTPIHYSRCQEPGHTSYSATNCGACRSEALEATEQQRTLRAQGVPPDRVRQILAGATTDIRKRAAGDES